MSTPERVRVETEGPVAVVSLARPDKLNGLDFAMMDGLVTAARQLGANRSVRAVILRGDGDAFCAGLDFTSVGKRPGRMLLYFLRPPWQEVNRFQQVAWAWRTLPQPVIAVLHGHCFGGGLQIALGADFRIATPDAEISMMEARWGLIPDMSGTVTLAELVGIDTAKRLTMTGEIISGERAAAIGLISEVAEDPLTHAQELAGRLAGRSPDAVTAAKRLFNENWHRGHRPALGLERRLQITLIRGANHKIARTAGIAREIPRFLDRTLKR